MLDHTRCIAVLASMLGTVLWLTPTATLAGEARVEQPGAAAVAHPEPGQLPAARPRFTAEFGPLSDADRAAMLPHAWREGCPVGLDDLSLVRVAHWNMDGQVRIGELVVHRDLAGAVLQIFVDLFEARFPIAKMKRIEEYGGDDAKSMADNNSSAFNCRSILGKPGKFSNHAYGRAIDINPLVNPYVKGKAVEPPGGAEYKDRRKPRPGMVVYGDACHRAFTSRGWTWGGAWRSLKDYQHFEKKKGR